MKQDTRLELEYDARRTASLAGKFILAPLLGFFSLIALVGFGAWFVGMKHVPSAPTNLGNPSQTKMNSQQYANEAIWGLSCIQKSCSNAQAYYNFFEKVSPSQVIINDKSYPYTSLSDFKQSIDKAVPKDFLFSNLLLTSHQAPNAATTHFEASVKGNFSDVTVAISNNSAIITNITAVKGKV